MSVKGGILSGIKSAADIVSEAARKSAVAPITTKSDKKEALELIESEAKRKDWVQNKRNELGIAEDDPNYRKDALVPKEEVKRRQTRKFVDQIKQLEQDQITGKQYRTFIKENQPATKFNAEDLKTMLPSFTDVVAGLDARNQNNAKKGIVGLNKTIEKGEIVKTRLDIPSYNLRDIWVAQITADKNKTLYGRTAVLKNGSFSIEGKDPAKKVEKMMGVGKGEKEKTPFATMGGEWQNVSDEDAFQLAQKYIDDPEWTQVGFNPERHSFFYDKDTMMPVFNFDELVQVGPLVLAKIKKTDDLSRTERVERIGKLRELRIPDKIGKPAVYNEGGAIPMQQQMEMFNEGGLKDEGGTKDPVSGNEVPSGSLQEEVRDDIDAKLSPGEFVFPADVTRFLGLRFLMKLRDEAKAGLQRMEDMGQMGNSEEAVLDNDVPFEPTDLIIMAGPPEGKMNKMNTGGMPVKLQTGGDMSDFANVPGTFGPVPGQGRFDQLVGQPQFEYEIKKFRNDAGGELFIPFVRGNPVYQPPLGYTEVTETQQQEELADPTLPQATVETELGSGELGGGPDAGDKSVGEMSPTEQANLGQFNIDNPMAAAVSEFTGNLAEAQMKTGFGAPVVSQVAGITGALMNRDDDATLADIATSVFGFGSTPGTKGIGTKNREKAEEMRAMRANDPVAFNAKVAEFSAQLSASIDKSLAGYSNATVAAAKSTALGASPAQMAAHAAGVASGDRPQGSTANAVGGYSTVSRSTPFGYSTNRDGEVDKRQTEIDRQALYGIRSDETDTPEGEAIGGVDTPGQEAQAQDPAETGMAEQEQDDFGGDPEIATGGFIPKRKKQKKMKRGGLASR
tara:strand:+ start:6816 stop:9353 length:2538 start_codon:yes stop_codon:yes gene_type:complete